jgi:flagellar basal body rod protein FlgC
MTTRYITIKYDIEVKVTYVVHRNTYKATEYEPAEPPCIDVVYTVPNLNFLKDLGDCEEADTIKEYIDSDEYMDDIYYTLHQIEFYDYAN